MNRRLLALLACTALLAGCGQSVTTTATSSAEPDMSVGPVKPAEIDSLPLTMDELKPIVGDKLFTAYPIERRPSGYGCGTSFPPGWAQFRSARDTGYSNFHVLQEIALYSDPAAAKSAFDQQVKQLNKCSVGHITDQTPTSVTWFSPPSGQTNDGAGGQTRVSANILFYVESSHLYDSAIIAPISDKIESKIVSVA
ncbi:sensor domain-containing protein [Mycobacteroides abscessus]|uniref:sensor domain-containing protein n=1 Tax=Mycobacteroides abscessus TaxID=36809 RepID=UPI00103DA809|nr:sensor domain-containing protein [Mycobacteroides abscessus]